MRVHVVDPAAYTPPYDHALCSALGRAGAQVTLLTSRFVYGEVPHADTYERRELFYRAAIGSPNSRLRTATKLVEHVPDMLRYRRLLARLDGSGTAVDVVHFQWLAVQHLDRHLLPARCAPDGRRRPLVLTAHDILPREPRPGQVKAQRGLYERFDAIIVHSRHGRERLIDELGVDAARVHVIPHGVLALPAVSPPDSSLPPRSAQDGRPVVLMFGLLRPYKGLDVLLEAWRGIEDAELWVVGMPRCDISSLQRTAPPNVRFVTRWIDDGEMAAWFERADLVVLPYRQADQSGVAFTALGAGVPMLLSDVGGFPELAATGAARTFPAGDVAALNATLAELLADPTARAAMSESARTAAAGKYSWDTIALQMLGFYDSLLGSSPKNIASRP